MRKSSNRTSLLFLLRVLNGMDAIKLCTVLLTHLRRVENILNGISEQNKLLYSSPEFIILPDMKWDLKTLSSLYLVAIAQDRTIKSLRDLKKRHVPLLQRIRDVAARIVQEKYGLGKGSLRSYIHYQPSYCMSSSYALVSTAYVDSRSLPCPYRQCEPHRIHGDERGSSPSVR